MTLFGKTTPKKSKLRPKTQKKTATKRDGKTPLRATPSDEARRIALLAAEAGLDKKATAVDILDVTGKVDYADFLVLMTGQNDRHVSAIAHAVNQALHEGGVQSVSVEGLPAARWVLIDFVDVVVHVFLEEARSLYDLDGLWLDAHRVPVSDPALAAKEAAKEAGKPSSTGKTGGKTGSTSRSPKPTSK
ncbi:MAG: ribosome silencing factor [Polyangiaceae bacterium]